MSGARISTPRMKRPSTKPPHHDPRQLKLFDDGLDELGLLTKPTLKPPVHVGPDLTAVNGVIRPGAPGFPKGNQLLTDTDLTEVNGHSVYVCRMTVENGIEMGVLADGRSFLTPPGLGVAVGRTPRHLRNLLKQDPRTAKGAWAKHLRKYFEAREANVPERLFEYAKIHDGGQTRWVHAVPSTVCNALLWFFAKTSPTAVATLERLSDLAIELYIRNACGFEAGSTEEAALASLSLQIEARSKRLMPPPGRWCIHNESLPIVFDAYRRGIVPDSHSALDISIALVWSNFLESRDRFDVIRSAVTFKARYPSDWPQSAVQIEPLAYLLTYLPLFRDFLEGYWKPRYFEAYLESERKRPHLRPPVKTPYASLEASPSVRTRIGGAT